MKRDLQVLRDDRGMTLIEIMIVLVIIAGISAILVPKVTENLQKANVKEAIIQIREIGKQLDMFYTDCGFYPSSEQGLQALIEAPTGDPACESWGPEPYIKNIPKDPWKTEFIYEESGNGYVLISLGRDRKEGGSGFDKDISSEEL